MIKRAKTFLTEVERARVVAAIEAAERETSGEIRVHLQSWVWGDPYKAAKRVFERLKMAQTQERNGILFFIVTSRHEFAILGDTGIHEKVGQDFWTALAHTLEVLFREGKVAEALEAAITRCGEELKRYFPCRHDDVNELGNELTMD